MDKFWRIHFLSTKVHHVALNKLTKDQDIYSHSLSFIDLYGTKLYVQ